MIQPFCAFPGSKPLQLTANAEAIIDLKASTTIIDRGGRIRLKSSKVVPKSGLQPVRPRRLTGKTQGNFLLGLRAGCSATSPRPEWGHRRSGFERIVSALVLYCCALIFIAQEKLCQLFAKAC